jgi:hypothetical protein
MSSIEHAVCIALIPYHPKRNSIDTNTRPRDLFVFLRLISLTLPNMKKTIHHYLPPRSSVGHCQGY